MRRYVSKYLENAETYPRYAPNNWREGYVGVVMDDYGRKRTIKAMLMHDFAVHEMVHEKRGYCITYAPAGFRISSRDRVFRSIEWAMHVAEELHPISNDWGLYEDGSWQFPEVTIKMWNYIFDVAETRGAFIQHLIPPGDRITTLNLKREW